MRTSLLHLLCCPSCRERLEFTDTVSDPEANEATLRCQGCGLEFQVEGGIAILGDRDEMSRYADRWPSGLTHEFLVSKIKDSRDKYLGGGVFREWVDAAAGMRGTVLDIATGPGSSLLGALAPLLTEQTLLLLSDASLYLLPRLKAAWESQRVRPPMDFVAMDGNRWPFRDAVLDGVTSRFGFGSVWDDAERKKSPRFGRSYREASRTLKSGGSVFESCLLFADDSETAAMLEAEGCVGGSRGRLESFWRSLGFEVTWAEELRRGQGKLDPGDLVPIAERDRWWEMAYVLRKPR